MKRNLLVLAMIALVVVACTAPLTPTPTPAPTVLPSLTPVPTKSAPTSTPLPPPTVPPLSLDVLKNAEYTIEGPASGKAKLVNGTFKEPIPRSTASVTVAMSDVTAVGDLNGDGAQDAAVILIANTGGSGNFYYLFGVLNDKGTPKPSAPEFLGDRIKLKALAIQGSEIVIDFMTQGPRDTMVNPTLPVTRKYKPQDGKLVSTILPTPTTVPPTKAAVVATPRPAVTATATKPPLPKGSIAFHWNDAGVDRISVFNLADNSTTPLVVSGPVMDLRVNTNAHLGEWSPDGSRFAYIFAGTLGASNILRVLNGGTTTDIYSSDGGGGLSSPSWSPDGKQIAFIKMSADQQSWRIIVINADGSKCGDKFECLNKLVAGEQYRGGLAWSKQGTFAVGFNTTGANDVYLLYSDGGLARNLSNHAADDGSPAFSPDGKQIAFTSVRDGKPQIYIVNADGTGLRRVSNNQFSDFSPTWSPDGRWIAFASNRDGTTNIFMMDTSGGNVTQLTKTGGDHPVWSR